MRTYSNLLIKTIALYGALYDRAFALLARGFFLHM